MAIANALISRPSLFDNTAIVITFDEGGGYYDSGYIQSLDFFGDGTRIPLLLISPYARPGNIDHTYADHASILKFIEANWNLGKLSSRSRDNLPNPITRSGDPYVPSNCPAIGDLMSMFDFTYKRIRSPLIIPEGL
ncbi:MAG TPA: alkaline phosphatase family protein [Candidatus Binataceae bacterium]